jgi:hypothetical protein
MGLSRLKREDKIRRDNEERMIDRKRARMAETYIRFLLRGEHKYLVC